jgi:S-adenosylmethionine hydrolase
VSGTRVYFASDYGLDDEFVGVVHAVLATLAPDVGVVDLAHGIPPFDVAGGAALLARCVPSLGPGVLMAVVDPGVGTARRAVALEVAAPAGPRHLVGPDNGLLLDAANALGGVRRCVALPSAPARGTRTFDGRDVFAPAAAHLATGAPLASLGPELDASVLVALPVPRATTRALDDGRVAVTAVVRWIDRFGNVALALDGEVLEGVSTAGLVVRDEDALVRVVGAFAELEPGAIGLLRDANDAVAVVVREGSASSRLRVAVGDRVELVAGFGRVP